MATRARWVVIACCAVLACACQATSDRDAGLASQLADRDFIAASADSVEGIELVEGTEIRLHFGEGELSGHAGCNHLSGTFRIEGDGLRIIGLGMTEIGCEPALHAQDTWLAELLTGSPTIALDEPTLVIRGDQGTLTLVDREIGSPDRPLAGTPWIGNGMGDGDAISIGPGSGSVTLRFTAGGDVEVFTGCQGGAGKYTASDTTIEFTDLGYAEEPCANPALDSVASQVRLVLDGSPVRYTIEEANLTIERADRLLLFRAGE